MKEADAQVGGEIDAWCTKCKLELNHTVVAKYDGKVKRVQCLTCGGQHGFGSNRGRRLSEPAKTARKTTRKTPAREPKLEIDANTPARAYAVTETFAEDEIISHPRYGRGLVLQARGDKIDVKFTEGQKTLVQGRQPAG